MAAALSRLATVPSSACMLVLQDELVKGSLARALARMMRHEADTHVQTSAVVVMGLLARHAAAGWYAPNP